MNRYELALEAMKVLWHDLWRDLVDGNIKPCEGSPKSVLVMANTIAQICLAIADQIVDPTLEKEK
jgi:hypothetical protein